MLINLRNALMAGKRLPYDAEVEYLESTGTQWIDTGMFLSSEHSVFIDYQLTSATQYRKGLFGGLVSRNRHLVARYGTVLSPTNGNVELGYGAGNVFYQIGADTNRHTTFQDKNAAYYDGELIYTFATATFTVDNASAPLGNFAYINYAPASAKYFAFQCDLGTTPVRDFIPVRFTNELGVSEGAMFDRANPTVGMNPDGSARTDGLYRNRGTGAFVLGPDI